jgi:hypothetical protein
MRHAREDYERFQDPAGLIPDDEPVFLIRGQDQIGATVVQVYALFAELAGADPDLVQRCRDQADRMANWPKHKVPDLADSEPADQEHERVGGRMAVGRDWRPIDTAPKDGTVVLLSCSRGPALACWSHEECGPGVSGYVQYAGWFAVSSDKILLDEGGDTGAGYRLEVPNPTHWMPVPEPPTCDPAGRAALAAEGE